MRGLLVTPWFAAGAGFVIAAALSLHSPRTFLTYRPNTSPCASCVPQGVAPGVQVKTAHPAVTGGGARESAPPPRRVSAQVGTAASGFFTVIFAVPARSARHGWSLAFTLPNATITYVRGAQWHRNGAGNGGLAIAHGPERIVVLARGQPITPGGCLIDGHACKFTVSSP